jgi:hypothetical protein
MNINAVLGAEDRELIRQTNIDIAIGGLSQLGQLRCLCTTQIPHTIGPIQIRTVIKVQNFVVKLDGLVGTGLINPANQLGVATQVSKNTASQDAFRAKCHKEVFARNQTAQLLQFGGEAGASGADRKCRFIDHQGALTKASTNILGRRIHPTKVRNTVVVDKQRDNHDNHVTV